MFWKETSWVTNIPKLFYIMIDARASLPRHVLPLFEAKCSLKGQLLPTLRILGRS